MRVLGISFRMRSMKTFTTINAYIRTFPKDVQSTLKKLKAVIAAAAPGSEEAMKYGMPTFVLGKNLVHFAAYRNHVGFYPSPSGIRAFKKELNPYVTSKGAIQFPIDEPVPFALVKKIVQFRVVENTPKKFPDNLSNPAQRALAHAGIRKLEHLTKFDEKTIANLHGLGPSTIVQLRKDLKAIGKSFAKK